MAHRTSQDEEVEDAVHVASAAQAVEESPRDIAHPFGNNPHDGRRMDIVDERTEGDEHRQSHQHEADGLYMAVLLQTDEADDGAHNGTRPHQAEEQPAPRAVLAKGDERHGRVAAGYMPVDGSMIEAPQTFLGLGESWRHGMIDGRGDIGRKHAEEIEPHAGMHPAAAAPDAQQHKDDAKHTAQQDACGMGCPVDGFLAFRIVYAHGGCKDTPFFRKSWLARQKSCNIL